MGDRNDYPGLTSADATAMLHPAATPAAAFLNVCYPPSSASATARRGWLPAPLLSLEGYASERMTRVHARALRLAGQLGSEPEPPLMWSLAMAALARGEWEPAREFGERLRARAERDDDRVLAVESGYLRESPLTGPGG